MKFINILIMRVLFIFCTPFIMTIIGIGYFYRHFSEAAKFWFLDMRQEIEAWKEILRNP